MNPFLQVLEFCTCCYIERGFLLNDLVLVLVLVLFVVRVILVVLITLFFLPDVVLLYDACICCVSGVNIMFHFRHLLEFCTC